MPNLIRVSSLVAILFTAAADARAQFTRVSLATDGTQANGPSDSPSVSADGRFVAFVSSASNLVANDTNGTSDVFVRDRTDSTTVRLSVTTGGAERTGHSLAPQISADGRFVVFISAAPLVAEDTQVCQPSPALVPKCQDVYVHDRSTAATTRVSVSSQGAQANGDSFEPHISGDGRFVVFESEATNLAPGDPNDFRDAFLHDRVTGTTTRLIGAPSVPSVRFGEPEPRISDDGSLIAFSGFVAPSALPPTAAGTPPACFLAGCPATFLYVRSTGAVQLLSQGLPPVTSQNELFADEPAHISADGRVVVIKQVMLVPNSNPLQADARFIVHDRQTGSVLAGPWRSTGLPAEVVGFSADARYGLFLGPTSGGQHQRIVRDRVAGLDDTMTLPASPGSEADPIAMSLSADGRVIAFAALSPLIAADTNATLDAYVLDRDGDGDGLPSAWETRFGLDPDSPADAAGDPDGDGVSNLQEYVRGSHADKGFTRYLAEGAANGFMTTRLAVLNPQDTTVEAAFRLLGSSGIRTTLLRTLPPRSRSTITLQAGTSQAGTLQAGTLQAGTLQAGTLQSGSAAQPLSSEKPPENDFATVVESTQPIVVDRTMTWDARGFGAHAETSLSAPATTWHLAEGATHGAFDLFYLLLNGTGTDTIATVKYLRPSPLPPVVRTYGVPANGRRTIWVDAEGPDLAETDVSAVITADQPIVVERAMYASTPTQAFAAGHDGAGLAEPALTWFLAEGATGTFFDLYLLVANPGTADAAIDVKYLLPSGASVSKSYVVAHESRLTITVDDQDALVANTSVAMVVTSTNNQPVVVERAMWWPSGQWYESHLAAGTTTTGTTWALAEGEIQTIAGQDPKETYILIANTSPTAGSATVTLLVEGTLPAITLTVALPGESRVNVPTSGLFPAGTHASFGALIDSHGLPVVVERSVYTTVNGVTWAAGTAAIATKLQ